MELSELYTWAFLSEVIEHMIERERKNSAWKSKQANALQGLGIKVMSEMTKTFHISTEAKQRHEKLLKGICFAVLTREYFIS